NLPNREGIVYLIQCGIYFKIGKSINPSQRYATLKIQLPEKPIVIHEIATNNVDFAESHWHKMFFSKRKNGEWFSLDSDDVAAFRRFERMTVFDDK
ncbi:MAG: GIY-YIG nuclease family protein, partial [Planctomycetaceae bacterium]